MIAVASEVNVSMNVMKLSAAAAALERRTTETTHASVKCSPRVVGGVFYAGHCADHQALPMGAPCNRPACSHKLCHPLASIRCHFGSIHGGN